jgi:hypothetical protein
MPLKLSHILFRLTKYPKLSNTQDKWKINLEDGLLNLVKIQIEVEV